MRALFSNVLMLLTFIGFVIFILSNSAPVVLGFFPLPFTVETSVSVVVICAFACGAFTGAFIVGLRLSRVKRSLRKAHKMAERTPSSASSSLAKLPSV